MNRTVVSSEQPRGCQDLAALPETVARLWSLDPVMYAS